MNKVERSMSVLNLGLEHTSLARKEMDPWAEALAKHQTTMKSLRDVRTKHKEGTRAKAIRKLSEINGKIERLSTATTVNSILRALGNVHPAPSNSVSNVSSAIEANGGMSINQNGSLAMDVLKTKRDRAAVKASQDFREQWRESIQEPIDYLSQRFSRLKTDSRPIVVRPHVPTSAVEAIYDELNKIDQNFTPDISRAEDLKKVPKLALWMDTHTVRTPYSISFQRCGNVACCGEFVSPTENGVRDLVMQRQPTPRLDPRREGHFRLPPPRAGTKDICQRQKCFN